MNLFITSDKQGSGKTFIMAGLAATLQSLGYSVGYYKPIQTGAMNRCGFVVSQDLTFVKKIDPNVNTAVSYVLQSDGVPLLAAQNEDIIIKPEVLIKDFLKLRKKSEIVLVEAFDGILTPFSRDMKTTDFIQAMNTSMLMVVEPSKDVLEKILLTVSSAKTKGIDVRGIILNKFIQSPDDGVKKLPALIEEYSGVPILGIVGYRTDISPSGLIDTILHSVDLEGVLGMKIPKLNIALDNN